MKTGVSCKTCKARVQISELEAKLAEAHQMRVDAVLEAHDRIEELEKRARIAERALELIPTGAHDDVDDYLRLSDVIDDCTKQAEAEIEEESRE